MVMRQLSGAGFWSRYIKLKLSRFKHAARDADVHTTCFVSRSFVALSCGVRSTISCSVDLPD